jgi:hypothetical protein
MVEITLTDGICRIRFDYGTIQGLEITPAGPNIKHIKDRSESTPFASIGVENLGFEDLFTGADLNAKGNAHFLRLIRNLAPDAPWTVRGVNVPGRFFTGGPGWLTGGLGWFYVLITNEEAEAICSLAKITEGKAEAICAFARINADCMCYVASIFHEGDKEKVTQIKNLIESVQKVG